MQRMSARRLATTFAVVAAAGALLGMTATASGSGSLPNPFRITHRWSEKSLGLRLAKESLAVAPDGHLYSADRSNRIVELSPAGKVLRRFGRPGRGPGEFRFVSEDPNDPSDVRARIAIGGDGKVYVVDSGNSRIEVFTQQGRFVRQIGSFGRGKGQFLAPLDVVADAGGNVYATDDQLETLRKFSPSGKVLWMIGGGTSADSDLNGHFHLFAIDAHGRLVLTNDDKRRVLYVDGNGHKVDAFGKPGDFPAGPCEASLDASGYTYVNGCGPEGNATEVFDPAHMRVAEWPNSPLSTSPRFGPNGAAFALTWNGSIVRLAISH